MLRALVLTLLLACASSAIAGPDADLLLHYTFDHDGGGLCRDSSGNGLDGEAGGTWVDSPSGRAMAFDGTAATAVRLTVPEELAFGRGSWSFMAWVRPTQLAINEQQNQRRIFSYGAFPEANMVIDVTADGVVSSYFCYRADDGTIVSAGARSGLRVVENEWAHVALSCDRMAGTVSIYVNGYCEGPTALPAGFDGNYSEHRALTIGSGWHNFWGAMDEVRVHRRALSRAEVKAEFHARKDAFGVAESPLAIAAERREKAREALARANAAWAAGDFATARELSLTIARTDQLQPQARSLAHLRAAQACVAAGDRSAALTEYARIAVEPSYPRVHRMEAEERVAELKREAAGLPARDPMASRTKVAPVTELAAEVFVSTDGDDAADGMRERPRASLTGARDRVRELRADGVTGPICVRISPGEYAVTETLALTEEDGGRPGAPVVYRADGGPAVFYGGTRLSGFVPVTEADVLSRLPEEARAKVVQCELTALGIEDFGELSVRGFGQGAPPPTLELFVDGEPMTLARWPNEGFVGIAGLVEPGSPAEGKPSVIEYISDRPARWTEAEDPWLFGYFRFLWADATIAVAGIDTDARTITTAGAYRYGGGGMANEQGIQYYAFNLLEEIDRPGEWYLNRTTGVLYLYPPADLGDAVVEIGMFDGPMVAMNGVSHVRFEGLTFDLGRYRGFVLEDCSDCLIAGCTVSRMADNGIVVRRGARNVLLGCDVHTIGRRATEVIGGDRETLKPGGHVVENCRIYDFGRIDRTYTPAIQLEGVGNRVAHNLLYDCPSSVMRIEGNDHVIEYNEIHSAVRESDDQGAIDIWRNATYRGVVFRHNYFHHIGKTGTEAQVHGQAAIRFDDAISGMLVYGNVFYRCANGNFGAIQINAGRDNVIDNNIFVDCKQGISGGWFRNGGVWRALRDGEALRGFIVSDLYMSRYPALARMLDEPAFNFVWRNVFADCGRIATRPGGLDLLGNGVFDKEDPGFVDAATGDVRLKSDAPVFERIAFRPIPMDEIGLYEDEFRATWPVVAPPVAIPDWREDGQR